MIKFRDLHADEIDCRVQMVKENGVSLLLYKDARVDMNILDETVGCENWQRDHFECKGNLFCRVGIRVEGDSEGLQPPYWVWKADCGVESTTEKQKGESSDSFKRAGFCWGIGRELYTAPFIWIPANKCSIQGTKCYDRFRVEKIIIEDKQITALSIINDSIKSDKVSDKRCFIWQKAKD